MAEDNAMLTPWQKEHLKYLKEKGEEPSWQSSASPPEEKDLDEEEMEPELEEFEEEWVEEEVEPKEPIEKKQLRRFILIFAVFLLATCITSYFVSPLSKLQKVTVTGNEMLTNETVMQKAGFKLNESIWKQYFSKKENVVKIERELPKVKNVTISLSGFTSLNIAIKEYKIVAYDQEGDGLHGVLENGTILKEVVKQDKKLPMLSNFKTGSILKGFLKDYDKVSDEIKDNINKITLTPSKNNPYRFTIYMKDGNQVIASTKDFVKKIKYYPKVVEQMTEKGVIDMEVGIFSYPFNKETEKTQVNVEN